MAEQATTFAFAGDEKIGDVVLSALSATGFSPEPREKADVVFTYATSISALEDLYYDEEGLLQATREGAILVDLSPSTPTFAYELDAVAQVNGRSCVDAPISLSNMVAEGAFANPTNVGISAGGDEAAYKAVEPMLRALAARVMWMGAAGAGQSAKVTHSLAAAAALVGLVEAQATLSMTEHAASPEDMFDFFVATGMLTEAQEALLEAMQDDEFEGDYTIEHLMAETAAAIASIEDGDYVLPQAEAGFRLMELLAMVGGIDMSPAALKLVFASEEAAQENGLDWSRAEGAYEDHCDCGCEDDECGHDHECECGHDPHEEHECCGKHHH